MNSNSSKWYTQVTRYQWLVLVVASLGWVFDAFEGQLYNITRADMLPDLIFKGLLANPPQEFEAVVAGQSPERIQELRSEPQVDKWIKTKVNDWGDKILGIFLIGGTIGGWLFSSLADRWGRKPVMALTILFYSIFSGLTAFSTELWHVGILRFFVAMGVGGEWAVGAALVAEVFPKEARERASGIFHATSVAGLWLAAAAGLAVGSNWRWAYMLGVIPALLVLWVRASVKEPESWQAAKEEKSDRMGSFKELLGTPRWRSHAVFGALLAMVGLATFWGVVVAGQDIANHHLKKIREADIQKMEASDTAKAELLKKRETTDSARAKVAFGFIQTTGAGLGMLVIGPLCAYWGRRSTFAVMHLAALVMTFLVCWLPYYLNSYLLLLCLLPIFGFFAQGIHAGYAIYFPELFPTHLRATGAGFCFNTGRILASPVLIWVSPWMKNAFDLKIAISFLGCLFLLGLVFLVFLPETKDQPLPE